MEDEIIQGVTIAFFSCVALSAIGWCIRARRNNVPVMKQSPSMEELTSVGPEDPTTTN